MPGRRFSISRIISVVALASLVVVTVLWWDEVQKRFPSLADGVYTGKIEGLGGSAIPLYVERRTGRDELLVVLLNDEYTSHFIPIITSDVGSRDWLMPLVLSGPGRKLKFTGAPLDGGAYAGKVFDIEKGARGRWNLRRVTLPALHEETEIRQWLSLARELQETNGAIRASTARIAEQRSEIQRVSLYISEGKRLKQNAEQKYQDESRQLLVQQKKTAEKLDVVKRLRGQLDIAQRVTGTGKLVTLSRDSLEKDRYWMNLRLGGALAGETAEFEEAAGRAEKLYEIRHQIALERERIRALENPEPSAPLVSDGDGAAVDVPGEGTRE